MVFITPVGDVINLSLLIGVFSLLIYMMISSAYFSMEKLFRVVAIVSAYRENRMRERTHPVVRRQMLLLVLTPDIYMTLSHPWLFLF